MSDFHREIGHFPNAVKKALRRLYSLCPVCGRAAEHFDHIFPLQWHGTTAQAFGFATDSDLNVIENGWRLCHACHHSKSVEENKATFRADGSLSAVFGRWYARAFDNKGNRRFWQGPVTDKLARNHALKNRTRYYAERAERSKKSAQFNAENLAWLREEIKLGLD